MDVSLNRCSGSSARYHNGWVLTEWKHNGWIYSGQAIQPALAQFQRQQTMDVVLSPGPKRYSYRLSSGVVALSSALSSALSAWFLGTSRLIWLLFSSCTYSCRLFNAATSIPTRIKTSLRPNLEALHLPSSVLSPHLQDRSASSVVSRPRKRQTDPTLDWPILPIHHSSSPSQLSFESFSHFSVTDLLRHKQHIVHYATAIVSTRNLHRPSSSFAPPSSPETTKPHTNETRRLLLPWMVIAS
ncbi:unnamed protein product [Fusarium graminearum]|nr:unnamed protein product [Fusarium graminearum]